MHVYDNTGICYFLLHLIHNGAHNVSMCRGGHLVKVVQNTRFNV